MPPELGAAGSVLVGASRGVYVANDDNIRLTVFNALAGVTVTLAGRFQHTDGRVEPFEHRIVPTADRVASIITRRLAHGWIVDLHVYVNAGAPLTGQTFAIVSLVRGQGGGIVELATLAAGYVTAAQRLALPGSVIGNTLEGGGALRSITGTTPAAGAEILETVPAGARWELLTLRAILVTAVAAANRFPRFTFDDGAAVFFATPAGPAQVASLTYGYNVASGLPTAAYDAVASISVTIPRTLLLGAGARIRSVTAALQGADQWSAPQFLVREWIEGA